MEEFNQLKELEIIIEGLDQAEVRPVTIGKDISTDYYKAIYNTTKNQLETIVPKPRSYLIEHKTAFQPFINTLKDKKTEAKGHVYNFGGRVIIEAIFNDLKLDYKNDDIQMGARLENRYDIPWFGGSAFGLRSLCTNGMIFSKVNIARFSSAHMQIANLEKTLLEFTSQIYQNANTVETYIKEAIADELKTEAKKVLLDLNIAPRTIKKMEELFEVSKQVHRYDLYNVLTQYATHHTKNENQKVHYQDLAQRVLVTPIEMLGRRTEKE